MHKFISKTTPFLILIVVGLFAVKALFHSGFYTSHDGWHQVARLYHFDQAIRDGQFPPRWSGGLLNGFGYPLFIFSYHLPWIIAEPIVLLGLNIFDAIKLVFVLTYLLSGITMYLWLRDMYGTLAGFTAAFVYLFTPYHFSLIFIRANIGEAVSFVFFPLIFWSLYRLSKKISFPSILIGSIGIAGFLLSHVMVVFLFFLPGLLTFFSFFSKVKKKTNYLLSVLLTGFLGLGLSAYYLLPAIYYKPITVFTEMYKQLYREHFTPLSKLLYSPWGVGAVGIQGEMSRQIGIMIWITIIFTLFISMITIIRARKFNSSTAVLFPFLISFLVSVWLMMRSSAPFWKTVMEPVALIDFPWRFLAVTTFCGSILAGYLVTVPKSHLFKLIVMGFILVISTYTNRNHLRVNQYTDIPLSLYIASELTTNTDDEYLPKWVNREYARKTETLINDKEMKIDTVKRDSKSISFSYLLTTEPKSIDIRHMYFPGMNFYIDGERNTLSKGNNGTTHVILPKGEHNAQLVFEETIIMKIGDLITFFSIIVVGYFILRLTLQRSIYIKNEFKKIRII